MPRPTKANLPTQSPTPSPTFQNPVTFQYELTFQLLNFTRGNFAESLIIRNKFYTELQTQIRNELTKWSQTDPVTWLDGPHQSPYRLVIGRMAMNNQFPIDIKFATSTAAAERYVVHNLTAS